MQQHTHRFAELREVEHVELVNDGRSRLTALVDEDGRLSANIGARSEVVLLAVHVLARPILRRARLRFLGHLLVMPVVIPFARRPIASREVGRTTMASAQHPSIVIGSAGNESESVELLSKNETIQLVLRANSIRTICAYSLLVHRHELLRRPSRAFLTVDGARHGAVGRTHARGGEQL